MRSLALRIGVVAVVQLALVAVAVAPRLSARLTGDEYLFHVQAIDPIDPFRGAYVDLDYPDLQVDRPSSDDGEGTLYLTLERDGDVWTATGYSRSRPATMPYLTCDDRDWAVTCGIESLFLPQDDAAAMQDTLRNDGAVAVVRVDDRGNAALVRVEQS
jgi:uncharacterized membrane-anchored protein